MQNRIINFSKEETKDIAAEYFFNTCGFHGDKENDRPLMEKGMSLRDEVIGDISVKAIVSSFGAGVIKGKIIDLNGIQFECNAFEQINKESIEAIYIYILTAGNWDINSESMMHRLYADIWGTAYVDAGRDLLCREIQARHKGYSISDSLGPGYYGMEVTQLKNFFQVLDAAKIEVTVKDSCLMVPVKSNAGFYIVVNNEAGLPQSDCKDCIGNSTGCQFCKIGRNFRGPKE